MSHKYDNIDESIQTLFEQMGSEEDRLIGMENLIKQG